MASGTIKAVTPSIFDDTVAIVEKTNTATHAIAAGKYVVWKGHLYKASSAISVGDTLSSSNLTAVSDGLANNVVHITGDEYISGTKMFTSTNIYIKNSSPDITKTNNDVSTSVFNNYLVTDKNENSYAMFEGGALSNGKVIAGIYARNYLTSDSDFSSWRGIQITIDKSNNVTWGVADSAAFRTAISAKGTQTAKSDPTASGTSATFIDTISQDAQGVITATKKTVRTFVKSGSGAASGLVPAPSTTAGTTKFLREDATWQTALTSHQDISGKKNTQSAVSDPSASGVSTSFIATLSQNAQGVVTVTKKKVTESFSIPASGSKTFNIGDSYRGVFFIIGGTASAQNVITVYSTSAGAVAYQNMGSSSNLTVTTGTGTIKIANSLTYAQSCYVMTFSGSVS